MRARLTSPDLSGRPATASTSAVALGSPSSPSTRTAFPRTSGSSLMASAASGVRSTRRPSRESAKSAAARTDPLSSSASGSMRLPIDSSFARPAHMHAAKRTPRLGSPSDSRRTSLSAARSPESASREFARCDGSGERAACRRIESASSRPSMPSGGTMRDPAGVAIPAEPLSVVLSCLDPHIWVCPGASDLCGPEQPRASIASADARAVAACCALAVRRPVPGCTGRSGDRLRVASSITAAAAVIATDAMSPMNA